jgi:hypothetical protein
MYIYIYEKDSKMDRGMDKKIKRLAYSKIRRLKDSE